MRRFRLLYRREISAWLTTPANYLMGAAFLALTGIGFWVLAMTMPGRGLLTSEITFGGMLFWMAVVAISSVCSVRLLGDEQERGTLELLLTAPVREGEIILAKFCAGVVSAMMLGMPAACYPWLLRLMNPGWTGMDAGAWAAGVLILLLVISLMTALGMLVSQLLRRQTAAAAATFLAGCLIVFRGSLRSWIGEGGANGVSDLVGMSSHVASFAAGIVDSRPVIFYLTGVAALLFLNIRLLQRTRYGRRTATLNVIVSCALTGLLVVMVNYVSMRHGVRGDWNSVGRGPLTERTGEILSTLKTPVQVTLLAASSERFVPAARRLLDQYRQASDLVQVRYVDPDVDLGLMRDLARRFHLKQAGMILVESGLRWKVLPLDQYEAKRGEPGRPGRRGMVFLSNLEEGLSAALFVLSRETVPVVYFLSGHGERSVNDFGDHTGYSEIADEIRASVAEVRSLTLQEASGVSNDCSVLVVAGPRQKVSRWEVERIREYLARSGRVLFLLDSGYETGLEDLLKEWGVNVGVDRIVDPRRGAAFSLERARTEAQGSGEVPVANYGRHPIADGLEGLVTVLTAPRSVEPLARDAVNGSLADLVDRSRVTLLAMSSRQSWAESDLDQQPPQFDEGYDRPGPLGVAVSVEKGVSSPIKMDIKPVRLAVLGDSQFAANRGLVGGNRQLLMNALDWLMERERPRELSAEEQGLYDLRLTPGQQWLAFILLVPAMPGILVVWAGVVRMSRRDRRVPGAPLGKEGRGV
jgi:ABC-type transport system involved in multi-copper enzyme maturation permease subunit